MNEAKGGGGRTGLHFGFRRFRRFDVRGRGCPFSLAAGRLFVFELLFVADQVAVDALLVETQRDQLFMPVGPSFAPPADATAAGWDGRGEPGLRDS
jgi:hypothetical protein